jgi:hypothetical protein
LLVVTERFEENPNEGNTKLLVDIARLDEKQSEEYEKLLVVAARFEEYIARFEANSDDVSLSLPLLPPLPPKLPE